MTSSPSLSLWTAEPAGQARLLADGRIPPDAAVVVVAAATGTPREATLEVTAPGRRLAPVQVAQRSGPAVWVVDAGALRAAPTWRATLSHEEEVLATLELRVDGVDLPRVLDLRVEAVLRDGTRLPASGAPAEEVRILVATADLSAPFPTHLTARVEDPHGRGWSAPALPTTAGGDPQAVATVVAPFAEGDWTVSLQQDRVLLRRVRLRLAPTPLGVRAATVLALGPQGARAAGPRLAREEVQGRLVLAYALAGRQPDARTTVRLALEDAAGGPLGAWTLDVDRGDPDALERVWFPLADGHLAAARGPVTARLSLDGAPDHVTLLELPAPAPAQPVATFRSDGVVLTGPDAAAPPPDFGPAQGFFGLVRRIRRRRRDAPPSSGDADLPF